MTSVHEQKSRDATARSVKDDAKEQAHQAKAQAKGKAAQLQEQVVGSAKQSAQQAKDQLADAQDALNEGVNELKRRGNKAIDENLTPEQKAKLNKASRDVKQAGARAQREADGILGMILPGSQLRPVRSFIRANNLQLPVLLLGALLALWMSLSLIRMITVATTPAEPEFDIHSLEASKAWARHHAGEYKTQAVDMKHSLTERAAHFLAHTPSIDSARTQAADWRDIGMKKLGLSEPTWSEWIMHYATGRPITWQGRVESVLALTKTGLKAHSARVSDKVSGVRASINDKLGLREPTLLEKVQAMFSGKDASYAARAEAEARMQAASLSGRVGSAADSLKANLAENVASIKAHIPGTAEAKAAAALAQAKLEAATHQSTLDKVASGAEYIKNRIVHGAEEAQHIAQDKANRVMDEAKLKAGL